MPIELPPVGPAAPDAPICRVETGGDPVWGGVDVFHPEEFGFSPQYNLYDRNQNLIVTVNSNDRTHKFRIGNNANRWEIQWANNWEIEWNGSNYGYNQVSIYFAAAVDGANVSALTQCTRTLVSPIALDLENKGRIQRIQGSFDVDLTGDGVPETLTQWFAPNAGILIDRTARGQSDSDALFGNVPGLYEDGYDKLSTLDANNDRYLTGDELSTLAIWVDADSDTLIEDHEVSNIASHKITKISLDHYKFMSRATKENGDSILVEDVWLPLLPMAIVSAK